MLIFYVCGVLFLLFDWFLYNLMLCVVSVLLIDMVLKRIIKEFLGVFVCCVCVCEVLLCDVCVCCEDCCGIVWLMWFDVDVVWDVCDVVLRCVCV